LRATPQRRLINDAVVVLGHATPEQVCLRVQEVAPTVSLSTVYRTLELLEELGVVSHTHLGHGAPTYHPADHADHIHLVCTRCGHIDEADVRLAAEFTERITGDNGFVLDPAHLSLHGLCAGCAGVREASAASRR